jgi:hypothetical protein
VASDQRQGVAGDLPNDFLQLFVGPRPCFDLLHQIHGHIDGVSFTLLFEGQLPAGSGATRPFNRAKGTFEEGADLGQTAQGGLASLSVPVGDHWVVFHVTKYRGLVNKARKKVCPKKKFA